MSGPCRTRGRRRPHPSWGIRFGCPAPDTPSHDIITNERTRVAATDVHRPTARQRDVRHQISRGRGVSNDWGNVRSKKSKLARVAKSMTAKTWRCSASDHSETTWKMPSTRLAQQECGALRHEISETLDETFCKEVGNKFHRIITIEDGVRNGGLGSAVLEWMDDHGFKARHHPNGVARMNSLNMEKWKNYAKLSV